MARTQQGFSLVEVLVAMLVLSAGALAAATALQQVAQALAVARHTTSLQHAASTKVAQFRSLAWRFEETSPGALSPIEDVQSDLAHERFSGGGHGIAPGIALDHIDGSGRWAGGATPAADAAVVRTWRVRSHGSSPNLRVMVVDVRGYQPSGGSASLALALQDRWVAVRSRGVE